MRREKLDAELRFNGKSIHFSKPVSNEISIYCLRFIYEDSCFRACVCFLQISFKYIHLRLIFWLEKEDTLRLCEHYTTSETTFETQRHFLKGKCQTCFYRVLDTEATHRRLCDRFTRLGTEATFQRLCEHYTMSETTFKIQRPFRK